MAAQNDDGRLNIQFTADDRSLKRAIRDNTAGMEQMAHDVESEGGKIDATFKRLGASVAAFFSIQQAAGMARQIALVRGQYQQLEVAFETMLQSQEKSVELMEQLTKTAATTPFGLEDVTQGAKQLLAYGFAAKDVNQTLIDLGNIAAGLSIPLNDLVYLYGTTMTQGRVYTQDMRQFMGRGIPLAEELAKQFGVTKDEVSALVTAGKVGFPEVEKAIKNMSGEGGKFYNLMEKQSHTITGQISNIEDAFQMMLNDIGKQSEGVINKTLEITSSLIENYEKIGKILADVVATYGIYKAAVIAGSAAQAIASQAALGYSAAEMVQYNALLLCEKAQKAFNKSILSNPYVMVAAAVLGLTAAIVKLTTHTNAAKKAQKELYDVQMDAVNGLPFDKEYRKEARSLDYLKDKLESAEKGSRQWNEARDEIVKDFGKYDDTLGDEIERTGKLGEAYDRLKGAIENTARARMYNAYVTRNEVALNKEIDDTIEDVEKRVKKYFGDGEKGGYSAGSALSAITKYIMGETKELDSFLKSVLDSSFRISTTRVNDARKAVQELDVLDEKARRVFGYYETEQKKVEEGDDPTPDEPKKDPEKVLDARYKALKAMEAFGEKEAESRKNIQNKINDAELEGMRDGLQKTLAQLYENFEREREEIEKQERETLKLIQEAEKEKWLAADPENRKERDFKPITTELPTEWANLYQKLYDALYKANMKAQEDAVKASEKMETDAMNQYLSQYGAYEEKRAAIAAIYDEKIRQSREDGDSEYVQKTLEQQKAAALSNLDMANESTYRMIFGDPAKMTKSTIEAAIDAAKKKLRELNKDANPQEWESLVNAVERLEGARDSMDMEGFATGWDNILKSAVMIRREEERIKQAKADGTTMTAEEIKLNEDAVTKAKQTLVKSLAATGAETFANSLQTAAQAMREIAQIAGDGALADHAEVLSGVAQNFSAAAQGAASGGWIGAIVAGVTDAFGQATGAATDAEVRTARATRAMKEYQKAIEAMAYDNDYESIFGVDTIASLKNAYGAARKALEDYRDMLTIVGKAEGTLKDGSKVEVEMFTKNIRDAVVAWGRGKKRRSTLSEMFPDIFDEDGNLIIDKARAAFDAYSGSRDGRYGDEGYKWLKAAIEAYDEYEKRTDEVDDYIRNAFGNMGDDLADAILQGADAFRVLEKSSADFLNSYMKDLLKSMLITEELKAKYTDRIREAVVSGDASALAGVLSDFNEEMTANIEAAQVAVETWQKAAAEAGIDTSLSLDDTSRGIAQASQDSVDELNGRFTAIQGHTANIEAQTRALAQNAASILEHVMGIHRDTADMAGQLAAIRRDVATIKDNQ